MAKFEDKWAKRYTPGLGDKINSALRHEGPLKPRIGSGAKMVRRQVGIIDKLVSKVESRDKAMLGKISAAKAENNIEMARALAGELAEMRRIKRGMMMVRLSLEKIDIRLSMYTDLGDTVSTIVPTIQMMRGLRSKLGRFIPEADTEINQMAETLGNFMGNTMDGDAFSMDQVDSEEAESIMKEAASVATEAVESKFPSMPTDVQNLRAGNL